MKIKDLVWRDDPLDSDLIEAHGIRNSYYIRREPHSFTLVYFDGHITNHIDFPTLEAAQAAANEHHKQKIMEWVEPCNKLDQIANIIETVDNRCMAFDGPVPTTLDVMTQEEISQIYALSKDQDKDWRP